MDEGTSGMTFDCTSANSYEGAVARHMQVEFVVQPHIERRCCKSMTSKGRKNVDREA